jgi:hypothetical protein
MTQWKLGTGSSYAGLTGFTWPALYGPETYEVLITKLQYVKPIPATDLPFMQDQGTQSVSINVQGTLWSSSDISSLSQFASATRVDASGNSLNLYQRLYVSGTEYLVVRNGSVRSNLFATNPLGYPYIATFSGVDPFVYTDSPVVFSSASSSTPSVSGIANIGSAYCFPSFTVQNNGTNPITAITITYGSVTLSWSGSLVAGATLTISQDYTETNNDYGPVAYVGSTLSGSVGGVRIALAANVSSQSMSGVITGSVATLNVIVPNRRWAR